MKATQCGFYRACRLQQQIVRQMKRDGFKPESCMADQVKCDDEKNDMDEKCSMFLPARRASNAR